MVVSTSALESECLGLKTFSCQFSDLGHVLNFSISFLMYKME